EPGAALEERIVADVATLDLEQIEAIDAYRCLLDREKEGAEVGLAFGVGRNQLAVNDEGSCWQAEDRCPDLWEAGREVSASLAVGQGKPVDFVKLDPKSVELQLIEPILAPRRGRL